MLTKYTQIHLGVEKQPVLNSWQSSNAGPQRPQLNQTPILEMGPVSLPRTNTIIFANNWFMNERVSQ